MRKLTYPCYLSMANIVEEDRNIKIIIKDEIIFFEIDMILMTQNINELI